MRYLLDTHTLLWWTAAPEMLPSRVRLLLDDRANDLLVSIVTPWELAIKTNSGKLDAASLLKAMEQGSLADDFSLLSAELAHVLRAGALPMHHRDPFDRLLIAQSLTLNAPILSADNIFDRYGVQRIWN